MTRPDALRAATLVALATLLTATTTRASDCYSIKDPDQRNQCLAEAQGQPSYCYSIRDPDERARCLAASKSEPSRCYGD